MTPKTTTTHRYDTPGGTSYYMPIVDSKLFPVLGKIYGKLEDCEKMYRDYAYASGFDVRKSSQKTGGLSGRIRQKYYVCSRAGMPKKVSVDTLENAEKPRKKTSFECTGCRAKVRFDWIYGTEQFKLADFEQSHNHDMVPAEYRHLSKKDRQMKYAEKLFVYNASISNIGPTKAHELYSNMKGCYQDVHGTVEDFRNWKRDLNVFINDSDSQILVDRMEEKKKYIPGFSFEYKLDDSELHSLFWADEVARCNYNEFSDIMSFDATYRTNRYFILLFLFKFTNQSRIIELTKYRTFSIKGTT